MDEVRWAGGRVVPASQAASEASEAPADALHGCFTTARWTGREIRFEARHLDRLARDATHLGLGALDRGEARRALRELARAAFGAGGGIVRLDACPAPSCGPRLHGRVRELGPEPPTWRAVSAAAVHDGTSAPAGAKLARRDLYDDAAAEAARAGADEALLFDALGRLVEGTRTNLVGVDPDGSLRTPPEARGGVAGVALAALDADRPIPRRDLARDELPDLRELIAVNAVRGAVAIVELDGRPVGDGRPGSVAARLAKRLDAAD